jgi:hypothetical protein
MWERKGVWMEDGRRQVKEEEEEALYKRGQVPQAGLNTTMEASSTGT